MGLLLLRKRSARELSLEEELQSHMKFAATEALAQGATLEQASLAARRDLGSHLRIGRGGTERLDFYRADTSHLGAANRRKPA